MSGCGGCYLLNERPEKRAECFQCVILSRRGEGTDKPDIGFAKDETSAAATNKTNQKKKKHSLEKHKKNVSKPKPTIHTLYRNTEINHITTTPHIAKILKPIYKNARLGSPEATKGLSKLGGQENGKRRRLEIRRGGDEW